METHLLKIVVGCILIFFASCNGDKVTFTSAKYERGVASSGSKYFEIEGYDINYNPNTQSLVTLYLNNGIVKDTLKSEKFEDPAQLSALLSLINSNGKVLVDKKNIEFHYTKSLN